LFREEYKKAEELCHKIQGLYTESYLPLGDVIIKHNFTAEPTNYYRDLNISDAMALTRFTIGNTECSREIFISAPNQVILITLKANKKGKLNFNVRTNS